MSACRRFGAQQKIHTKATEVRKGHEGLKGFRIGEDVKRRYAETRTRRYVFLTAGVFSEARYHTERMVLIRRLLMRRIFLVLFLAAGSSLLLLPCQVAAVQVTLILRNVTTDDFSEWKVSSAQKCTQSTGRIRRDTEAFEQTWYVGDSDYNNSIRFWWSRLNGEADATVLVNDVVVFRGHCLHGGCGKVRMIDTCAYPSVYKTGGSGPYLIERPDKPVTFVHFATSMLPGRFY